MYKAKSVILFKSKLRKTYGLGGKAKGLLRNLREKFGSTDQSHNTKKTGV